jgi:hypothetical protein
VQGQPAAGSTLTLLVTVVSDTDRPVALIAQLLTTDQQLVDIVRADHQATKGQTTQTMTIKLPASLPQGRYTAVVTGRFDKTKLVTASTSFRISAQAPEVTNITPAQPAENVSQPENVTPPEQPPAQVPPEQQPPQQNLSVPPDQIPSIEPVQQQVPTVGAPMPMEIDDIVTLAATNKDQALAECAKLPDSNLCLSRVAAALKDDSLCRTLQGFDADKCYLSVASAGKTDACANVQDQSLRATCEAVAKFGVPEAG